MKYLPQPQPAQRAARAHFPEPAPAVLRFKDGRRLQARLKTVSVTGGLLALPHPVDTGSNGKLMFLTKTGMVLASAEMLSPLAWGLQAFRFVDLNHDDQDKLQTIVQTYVDKHRSEQEQIERSRAW
jgi:hypothetical protein